MKQRPRIHYAESQKALMWERWQKGDTLYQTGQLASATTVSNAALKGSTRQYRVDQPAVCS
jgi:hypothetical protein